MILETNLKLIDQTIDDDRAKLTRLNLCFKRERSGYTDESDAL